MDKTILDNTSAFSLLTLIRDAGSLTMADLRKATCTSHATLSRRLTRLIEAGLVDASIPGASRGGRKPALLRIHPSCGYTVGVEITRTSIRTGLMDAAGKIIQVESFGLFLNSTPEKACRRIAEKVAEYRTMAGSVPLLGIGVCVVGPLDPQTGRMLQSEGFPVQGWEKIPIRDFLADAAGLPVRVGNGADLAALGEYRYGGEAGCGNLAYVMAGVGLRLGILVNGQILPGHVHEEAFGYLCVNGKPGAKLKDFVSLRALRSRYMERIQEGSYTSAAETLDFDMASISADTFFKAVETGDALALEILQEAADVFTDGLSSMIRILNPDRVILGGVLIRRCPVFAKITIQRVKPKIAEFIGKEIKFSIGQLGGDAGIKGAGSLILDEFFSRLTL